MVCVPCFIIPVLLFLWHKFIQPYVLRFWNPWAVKDADGNIVKTEFPFACEGGVCAFKTKTDEKKESPKSSDSEPIGHNDLNETSCTGRLKAE